MIQIAHKWSTNIHVQCVVYTLGSYLYLHVYCIHLLVRWAKLEHTKLSCSPSFTDTCKFIDFSSWIMNLLLHALACVIAVYFYVVCTFNYSPSSSARYCTQLLKIYSHSSFGPGLISSTFLGLVLDQLVSYPTEILCM